MRKILIQKTLNPACEIAKMWSYGSGTVSVLGQRLVARSDQPDDSKYVLHFTTDCLECGEWQLPISRELAEALVAELEGL